MKKAHVQMIEEALKIKKPTPDSKEGLHTQNWTRGSNYGGECNLIDGDGHIVGVNVDSDAADLIVKAVNERKALLDEIERLKHNNRTALLLALEFGYIQCEKGNNLEMAIINSKL